MTGASPISANLRIVELNKTNKYVKEERIDNAKQANAAEIVACSICLAHLLPLLLVLHCLVNSSFTYVRAYGASPVTPIRRGATAWQATRRVS